MAFFNSTNMEDCETPFLTCDNKEIGTEQLFRLLVAALASGDPAIRTCVANASQVGGQRLDHFVATAAQTEFTIANPVRIQAGWVRNGSFKHSDAGFVVGSTTITLPAQPVGTEITILS